VLANIKKQNNLDDEAKFQAALKQEGLSLPELRRNLEKSMLISQVQRAEVTEKISVTEEEAKAYYAERLQGVHAPSEVTLREILVEVPATDKGVNVAQDDEVKARTEANPCATEGGRAVSTAGRGLLRRAVPHQWRVDRPIRYDELGP
jgi:peptidyl-prolyl cis-trans isomerase SurA